MQLYLRHVKNSYELEIKECIHDCASVHKVNVCYWYTVWCAKVWLISDIKPTLYNQMLIFSNTYSWRQTRKRDKACYFIQMNDQQSLLHLHLFLYTLTFTTSEPIRKWNIWAVVIWLYWSERKNWAADNTTRVPVSIRDSYRARKRARESETNSTWKETGRPSNKGARTNDRFTFIFSKTQSHLYLYIWRYDVPAIFLRVKMTSQCWIHALTDCTVKWDWVCMCVCLCVCVCTSFVFFLFE